MLNCDAGFNLAFTVEVGLSVFATRMSLYKNVSVFVFMLVACDSMSAHVKHILCTVNTVLAKMFCSNFTNMKLESVPITLALKPMFKTIVRKERNKNAFI